MVKRNTVSSSSDRDSNDTSGESTETTERIDYWDTNAERAKQEIAYYQRLDSNLNGQILKELNAMLMMIRSRPGKLCQLDRQYLRSKLTLINAKLEASELCELQIIKVNNAHDLKAPLPR